MAIKHHFQHKRGFALLVALIFMSVMLSFGLALGSIGYKQQVLASDANRAQIAFYVADAALECLLYADQQQNLFDYAAHSPSTQPAPITTVVCDSTPSVPAVRVSPTDYSWTTTRLVDKQRLSLDGGTHCADVMISKPEPTAGGTTYLYAQGYDVSCATVASPSFSRFASRGISAHY